jgi:hypothetical protein
MERSKGGGERRRRSPGDMSAIGRPMPVASAPYAICAAREYT